MTVTETTGGTTVGTAGGSLDERLVSATVGALELFGVYLGDRLGLYAALRDGPCTSADLARLAGIAERYAREWLEQQAVAGMLTVDDTAADPCSRRYTLPEEHVGALVDPVAPDHVAPLASLLVGIAGTLDEVAEAYRSGGGVPFAGYGTALRQGQGAINRPAFTSALVQDWLPALGPVGGRIAAGGSVLDVACGQGWSTIALARAFPGARVRGIDLDPASIADARTAAAAHGVTVGFDCVDAAAAAADGPYDLALLLEALHDLARPVEVLTAIRAGLAPDGVLLVADEAVAASFTAPGNEIERMMYGWSITHCLPASLAEQPSAAIGTVIREGTVRELAAAAGFADVEALDVEGGFFRLYALRP